LLAQRSQALPEELSYVLDGSVSHDTFLSRRYEFHEATIPRRTPAFRF